jgi:hypothetical protein
VIVIAPCENVTASLSLATMSLSIVAAPSDADSNDSMKSFAPFSIAGRPTNVVASGRIHVALSVKYDANFAPSLADSEQDLVYE